MVCEDGSQVGVFHHALNLTLYAMWIADVISTLDSIEHA